MDCCGGIDHDGHNRQAVRRSKSLDDVTVYPTDRAVRRCRSERRIFVDRDSQLARRDGREHMSGLASLRVGGRGCECRGQDGQSKCLPNVTHRYSLLQLHSPCVPIRRETQSSVRMSSEPALECGNGDSGRNANHRIEQRCQKQDRHVAEGVGADDVGLAHQFRQSDREAEG